MATKENKGGTLTNDQVEQDNRVKGKAPEDAEGYVGSQDTGDKVVRQQGNDVQEADGRSAADQNGE